MTGRLVLGSALLVALLSAVGCTRSEGPAFGFDPDAGFGDGGFRVDAAPADAAPDMLVFPDATVDPCMPSDSGVAATVGMACTRDQDCTDLCYCNGTERCVGNVCAVGTTPCVDEIECTVESCVEEIDRCVFEPVHSSCSDGDACDGTDLCDVTRGCVETAPLYCNDENRCTLDSCAVETGCVFELRDLDGDGFIDGTCGGEDCDDDPRTGALIFPGQTEDCTNRRDDNCDGLRDYNDVMCIPTNDTCATARTITGAGTFSGATRSLNPDYALSCYPTGPDAVFRFVLAETSDVRITVVGAANAGIVVRPFSACEAGPDLRCVAGAAPAVFRRSLEAGEYAVIVKTPTATLFDLQVRLEPPTTSPATDVCSGGTETIPNDTTTTLTGNFEDTGADYVPLCRTGGGAAAFRDAVYRISLPSPKDITITTTTSTASGTAPSTFVSLVSACDTNAASTISCLVEATPRIRQRSLPAGEYFLIVESSSADATRWSINATITDPVPPPNGDACSTALELEPDAALSTQVGFGTFERESGTSCGGTTGTFRDGFFAFEIDETRDVTVSTYSEGGGSYFMSLQTTCGTPSSDLRCRSASGTALAPNQQTFRSLAAGRYFVTISTTGTGNYGARVTTASPTPVPPNDRCTGAIDLAPALTAPLVRNDTLIDFEDDVVGGSCAASGARDAFYMLTLTAPHTVIMTGRRIGSSTSPVYMTLRSGGCAPGDGVTNLACSASTSVAGSSASIEQDLAAGTYYLIVEQPSTDLSDFRLTVTTIPL